MFLADQVSTTILKDHIIGAAIFIENISDFNFSNLHEFKFSIQKDFDMRINLSNKSIDIPNHPPKIISNNSIDKVKPSTLRLDPQQALEQNFDKNLKFCSLHNIEPNKSFYHFENITFPTTRTDTNIATINFNPDAQSKSKSLQPDPTQLQLNNNRENRDRREKANFRTYHTSPTSHNLNLKPFYYFFHFLE